MLDHLRSSHLWTTFRHHPTTPQNCRPKTCRHAQPRRNRSSHPALHENRRRTESRLSNQMFRRAQGHISQAHRSRSEDRVHTARRSESTTRLQHPDDCRTARSVPGDDVPAKAANRSGAAAQGVLLLQDIAADSQFASGLCTVPAVGSMRSVHTVHDTVWSVPAARTIRADRSVQPVRSVRTMRSRPVWSVRAVRLSRRHVLAGDCVQSVLVHFSSFFDNSSSKY